MRSITRYCLALPLLVLLLSASCGSAPYTARVVDAETGEPVEGAVYLAVWWKTVSGKKAWFEGPSTEMARFVEGRTDEKGWVSVPRFWLRFPFARERTLTLYKPGYVLWNQKYVFPTREKRADFSGKNRDVRLERWKDEFSHGIHDDFLSLCTANTLKEDVYSRGQKVLYRAFRAGEAEMRKK